MVVSFNSNPARFAGARHVIGALLDSGKVSEVIEQQQKTVNVAANEDLKVELRATLKKYQEKAAPKPVAGN